MIAEVALNIPLNTSLDYSVVHYTHGNLIGHWARVPLGRRTLNGIIVGQKDASTIASSRLKPIYAISQEPALSSSMMQLTAWLASYYCCSWGEALNLAFPGGLSQLSARKYCWKNKQDFIDLATNADNALDAQSHSEVNSELNNEPNSAANSDSNGDLDNVLNNVLNGEANNNLAQHLVRWLASKRSWDDDGFIKAGAAQSDLTWLWQQASLEKMIAWKTKPALFSTILPNLTKTDSSQPAIVLNKDQQEACLAIDAALDAGQYKGFLLEGITGSGKTEVYLRCAQRVAELGRSCLLLTPEIALTEQLVESFQRGSNQNIAVLHSGMTSAQRQSEWYRAQAMTTGLVIGVRSAVFAPLRNVGLIIIDEEHEWSYKQDEKPRYHARDVAIKRAQLDDAVIVLGSATPALETRHKIEQGLLERLQLPHRIMGRSLPKIEIIDLTKNRPVRGMPLLSRQILDELRFNLNRDEQSIIFLNLRGYARLLYCLSCKFEVTCPNCSVALRWHSYDHKLRCHYCNISLNAPKICARCSGKRFQGRGLGTQQIELALSAYFKGARIARLDRDAIAKRGELQNILQGIRNHDYDIIIGTQMLGKGHDFPKVTLGIAMLADVSLHMPDFRATERTFQLLIQMAGRVGRATAGRVFIQTFNPKLPLWQWVKDHATQSFTNHEQTIRCQHQWPPYANHALLIVRSTNSNDACHVAQSLATWLRQKADCRVLGASPAPVAKIDRQYRWLVSVSSLRTLQQTIGEAVAAQSIPHTVNVQIDIDPYQLF